MEFLEKDLEQIIWETDEQTLFERGLAINGRKYRQLKIGNYGIADIVTFEREHGINHMKFTVYELKKEVINVSALLQAYSYVKGISSYLKFRGWDYEFEVVLIGKQIETSTSFCYLTDLIDNFFVFTYHMDIDGLFFTPQINYDLKNKGFYHEKKVIHTTPG